jgi:hypothetical protein
MKKPKSSKKFLKNVKKSGNIDLTMISVMLLRVIGLKKNAVFYRDLSKMFKFDENI